MLGDINDPIKLVVMGSGSVGKSTLVVQFVQHIFIEKYDPTIEDSYRTQYIYNDKIRYVEILDTAGTEQFISMRDLYIKNGHAFILLYSTIAASSLQDLDAIYTQIVRIKDDIANIIAVVCGTKIDLVDDRVISTEAGEQFAKEHNCDHVELSSKTKVNINLPFDIMIAKVLAKHAIPPKMKSECCIML